MNRHRYVIERGPCGISIEPSDPSEGSLLGEEISTNPTDQYMTKEQLAAMITGREYPLELTKEELADAKASGLVIVYGASDDLIELDGAVNAECGVYAGGEVLVNHKGIVNSPDDDETEILEKFGVLEAAKKSYRKIKTIWESGDNISWQYETDIPHAKFVVKEDGETYCIGLVFEASELP